jgi:hypothetical protein
MAKIVRRPGCQQLPDRNRAQRRVHPYQVELRWLKSFELV